MGLHVLAWVGPEAQGPHGTPAGGEIHSREGSQANIPPCSPRVVLPDARGPLEVLVGLRSRHSKQDRVDKTLGNYPKKVGKTGGSRKGVAVIFPGVSS